MYRTKKLDANASGATHAAELLRAGELVAFPTETVYGLGADACNGKAVARIYEAKGRPAFNPLIIHVADIDQAMDLAEFSALAHHIAEAFWPGPLSLVLPLRRDHPVSDLALAGLPSVALRVPSHPIAQSLLRAFGGPLAAPSANPSGRISPTTADHVLAGLSGQISAVIDAGACAVGLESTILEPGPPTHLLRPGGVTRSALEDLLGQDIRTAASDKITSPGQLSSHYAPNASLRLNATEPEGDEFLIGFGHVHGETSLSAAGDLREAAARLFAVLHEADQSGRPIACAPVPESGLGIAINDRLRRAAAPREQPTGMADTGR